MSTCVQHVLCLIIIFFVGVAPNNLHSNAASGVETIRIRRQAGYVYDRPPLSFNLPSRTNVGSTSTQATNVDRTSSQQMYYAYPAPTGGNTGNVGYTNTGSSGATSGTTGYNYSGARQNAVTGSTGSTGGGTVNIGYSSSGSTGSISSVTSSGSKGYNYGGGAQNTGAISTGGSTSTTTSGSGGYDYRVQNTGLQTNINLGSTGYTSSSSGSNSVISTGSISTKAPEYLPPANSGEVNAGVSVSTNTQTGSNSGTGSVAPTDTYIPPVTVTQTSNAPVTSLSSSYLLPTSGSQTSNVQNAQTQVTATSSGSGQSVPTQEYLPPVVTSTGTTEQGVSTPAAKYLPPVFK